MRIRTSVARSLAAAMALAAAAAADRLTILHTNDLSGSLAPAPYYGETRGGMARIVTLLRAHNENGRALVLDGGNALGPELLSQLDGGRLFLALMDSAGFTGMVPGNHELDLGPDSLLARARLTRFPLIAANVLNKDTGQPLLSTHALVAQPGITVLVTGVVSPTLQSLLNPLRAGAVVLEEPTAALQRVLGSAAADSAQFVIVLAHMPANELLALGRRCPQLGLLVGGGIDQAPVKDGDVHVVELANGTRIVSTPGRGVAVGRIDLELGPLVDGKRPVVSAHSQLLPVDSTVVERQRVAWLIRLQELRFHQARRKVVGILSQQVPDSAPLVAELLRHTLDAEVGMVNQGALRPVALRDTVRLAAIDTLVRFDDHLVRIRLRGGKLRALAQEAAGRARPGQQLVFGAYDPTTQTVAGIPLEDGELYSVATTGYLASGGDGFLPASTYAEGTPFRQLSLRGAVIDCLGAHARPMDAVRASRRSSSVKASSRLGATMSRTALNRDATRYGSVSAMSGAEALAWTATLESRLLRRDARSVLATTLKTGYGHVRQAVAARSREAVDRINGEAVYTLRQPTPSPFVSLNLATVWTVPDRQKRPLALRGSAGVSVGAGQSLRTRVGLGLERDLATGRNSTGLELAPELKLGLGHGSALASSGKVFLSLSAARQVTVEQYNTLAIGLWENLKISVDANLFLHRDDQVSRTGVRSELQMGLSYAWDARWPR